MRVWLTFFLVGLVGLVWGQSPTVSSFSPTSGTTGTTITITGTNFSSTLANNTVKFGTVRAFVTAATSTSITTSVPFGLTAAATITVTTAAGSGTSASNFSLTTPTISGISPTSGSAGTVVTISGTNFSTLFGANIVKLGAVVVPVNSVSSTSLTLIVPSAASTGAFTITTAGSSATSTAFSITTASALNVTQLEYFFDSVSDPGSGQSITISAGPNVSVVNNLPQSLSQGWHTLHVRTKDSNNTWGFYETRSVFVRPPVIATPVVPTVTQMEYFLDNVTDPGTGTALTLSAGTNVTLTNNIPQSLTQGWHSLHVRTKDSNNAWGFYETRNIYVRPAAFVAPALPTVTQMEYFLDTVTDPGTGQSITITGGLTVSVTNNIPQSLTQGWHSLHVRTRDSKNTWGFYETRSVFVRPAMIANPLLPAITQMEYFLDNVGDPGTGQAVTITGGTTVTATSNIPQSLSNGWHTLHARTKDSNSAWGFYETRTLYVRTATPSAVAAPNIVLFEYFVDTDPGVGLSLLTLTKPSSASIDLPAEPLTVGPLSLGTHTLGLRAKDQNGKWSLTEQRSFSVVAGCTSSIPPSATGAARCDAGPLTLLAGGAATGQTYRWYADNTTLVITNTGSPFTTPSLNVNTDYYVSIYDPTTYCESSRTKVSAIVSGIPKPALNLTGSLTVCQGNSVTLQAPTGFTSYTWSNGLTTQQITVATSGSYSVVVGNGTCVSPSSDPFSLTVNSNPSKPTVTATGGGSLCGAGSVTLSAPTGFASYSWSSGQSTQSISSSAIGNFSVSVTDVNGCKSVSSDIFSVTSSPLSKPLITVTGNTILCGGATVQLSAPSGFSSYAWSDGSTTQSITTSIAGNYSVAVSNGGCISPASDPTSVVQVAMPSKPTIAVTGSISLCNGSFTVLSAPTGFSNYLWSTGETTRQIVVSLAGNFTVQVGNAAACLSVASDPVSTTTTGLPCSSAVAPQAPTVADNNRCGIGTVTLTCSGATGIQQYKWYDASTGGNLLFTGSSFTTPSLTATTNYYVSIYDTSSTLESIRTTVKAVIVTINKPVISYSGSASFCIGKTLLLSAPPGFTQYTWSDGSTKQQLLVSSTGNYSVQVGNGVCSSVASDPVVVAVSTSPSKPTIEISGSTTFCSQGSVDLTGPSGFSYLWSNGSTTQKITATESGVYSLIITNSAGCSSPSSEPVAVTKLLPPCKPNTPPVIAAIPISVKIEGSVVVDLLKYITDAEDNIDFTRLQLLSSKTAQGATATIDRTAYTLTLDYKGILFSGTDRITLEVYDLFNARAQRVLEIDVVGEVVVFNGITPDGDGINDFFYIKYIDVIQGGTNNKVTIFSRWGDVVFEIANYNNIDRIFNGHNNGGGELPPGTYFYRIVFVDSKPITGYLTIKQ